MKTKVAILFGGRSAEHEISIISAQNVFQALDKNRFEVALIKIDKQGSLLPVGGDYFLLEEQKKAITQGEELFLSPSTKAEKLVTKTGKTFPKVDVVFPVLHGPFGEDGTIQGLLSLANIAFVGCPILASAIAMDKAMTKQLALINGIPTAAFVILKKFEKDSLSFEDLEKELGLPFFVKPVTLGSSVGVSKVTNKAQYKKALDLAFSYDEKIIIETFIKGREVEVGILGIGAEVKASLVGEVKTDHDFYSYAAKYTETEGLRMEIPASIPEDTAEKVRELALRAFKAIDGAGMARCDFFLKEDGTILLNEINPIPGFTEFSMYPKLWEATGIPYGKLIEKLIELAITRHEAINKLKTTYD
jgi:D-alanine-D-alanine ligase